jgi:glucose-1-phosphate thymidylyltransferase
VTLQKGIILAGGSGSRLYPLTRASNKQLLPIYDKPVIYYPLSALMLTGIRDILIISGPSDMTALQNLLGDGSQWGIRLSYAVQDKPSGLPEAFIIGDAFMGGHPAALILGDNFFYGQGFSTLLSSASHFEAGGHTFLYRVDDPRRYGVMTLDDHGQPKDIVEKPSNPPSNLAVTGLYMFDGTAPERARALQPSLRGETEITDLIRSYMHEHTLKASILQRGYAWFDVGTPQALLNASQYVEVIQSRQGVVIASPEEIAWRMGFISDDWFEKCVYALPQCNYRQTLEKLVHDHRDAHQDPGPLDLQAPRISR